MIDGEQAEFWRRVVEDKLEWNDLRVTYPDDTLTYCTHSPMLDQIDERLQVQTDRQR
jgi:hypothetical protein